MFFLLSYTFKIIKWNCYNYHDFVLNVYTKLLELILYFFKKIDYVVQYCMIFLYVSLTNICLVFSYR